MLKKLFLFFFLFVNVTKAQIVSVNPDKGYQGQQLVTTITLSQGLISLASPPYQLNDIYLQQGITIFYCSNIGYHFDINTNYLSDTVDASFNIPLNAAIGLYDLHVTTYTHDPLFFGQPVPNVLNNGFTIGLNAGVIQGNAYYDANQNGIQDLGEPGILNRLVSLQPPVAFGYTDLNGYFILGVDTGTFIVNVPPPPGFTQTSAPINYTVTIPPDTSNINFGFYAPQPASLTQNFSLYTHPMRCSGTGFSSVQVSNVCTGLENGSITIIHSSNLTVNNTSQAPNSINGDTLHWIYQLYPFQGISYGVTYNNPPAGQTVSYIVIDSLFDILGNFQQIYTDSFTFVVTCSFDPNDKSVSPYTDDSLNYTLKNSDLTYTIRFQNTGTDTAYTVIIRDTMDVSIDLNTLQILGSSHPVSVQSDGGRAFRFLFDNILLADSNVDEEKSHGWIMYKIHPNSNVNDYTPVINTAHILFDFNAPVVTNTTLNTLVTQIPLEIKNLIGKSYGLVYPNPISNSSMFIVPSNKIFLLRVYDSTGRLVLQKNISDNFIVSKNQFKSGVYHYQLFGKDDVTPGYGKFIVTE